MCPQLDAIVWTDVCKMKVWAKRVRLPSTSELEEAEEELGEGEEEKVGSGRRMLGSGRRRRAPVTRRRRDSVRFKWGRNIKSAKLEGACAKVELVGASSTVAYAGVLSVGVSDQDGNCDFNKAG